MELIKKNMPRMFAAGVAALAIGALAAVVQPPQSANASDHRCIDHSYRRSSSYSYCVKQVQRLLNTFRLFYSSGSPKTFSLATDGYFGYYTDKAVRTFQSHQGIGSDGVVGPITWGRLCKPRNTGISSGEYNEYLSAARSAGCTQVLQ